METELKSGEAHPRIPGRSVGEHSKEFLIAEIAGLRQEIIAWEIEQHTFFRHIFIASTAVASWIIYALDTLGFLAILVSLAPYAIARFGHTHMGALGYNINRMGEYIRLQETEHFNAAGWETFVAKKNAEAESARASNLSANRQLLFLRRFYILFALGTLLLVVSSQPAVLRWAETGLQQLNL